MNLKYSKQRDSLLKLLKSVNTHPSADWLYSELKAEHPNISLATVYRNLNVLVQCGDIIKLGVGDGIDRYDAITASHSHFMCSKCKSVIDIQLPSVKELEKKAADLNDIIVDNSSLIFYGCCTQCKNN